MTAPEVAVPQDPLHRRLLAVRAVLEPMSAEEDETPDAYGTLAALVEHARRSDDLGVVWLLLTGLSGCYPSQRLVRAAMREIELTPTDAACRAMLALSTEEAMEKGTAGAVLEIVVDRPVVDVHVTARSEVLTGAQRLVGATVREWASQHDAAFVAWNAQGGGYRPLFVAEHARLFGEEVPVPEVAPVLVVPWQVPLVLTDVLSSEHSTTLAALAQFTGTSVRLIGYDCIPLASAELVDVDAPYEFGHYLELAKFADRIVGISNSTATEFRGFTRALSAQGLPGPDVEVCPMPHTTPVLGAGPAAPAATADEPLVLSVGGLRRRNNQIALVEAAERLWRDGVRFRLELLAAGGADDELASSLIEELQATGRPLVVERKVSDARLGRAYREARCLVHPSLHDGLGLPVAEALSHGVPVITSHSGSPRELAEGQGGLLVDPEDVDALTDALRRLLSDDVLHARLVQEARGRAPRGWDDYAADLWKVLGL